jgi:hypothetical protein
MALAAREQQRERLKQRCRSVRSRGSQRGLQELGWTEGHNLEVKYSGSAAEFDLNQSTAKELIGLQCMRWAARG